MSMIKNLADAVAARLNTGDYDLDFTAVSLLEKPEYTLKELATLRVSVVPQPAGTLVVKEDRSQLNWSVAIDVFVQKAYGDSPSTEKVELLGLVEDVVDDLAFIRPETFTGAMPKSVTPQMTWSDMLQDEARTFLGVVTVTYKVVI
jgi:hypothetical protein